MKQKGLKLKYIFIEFIYNSNKVHVPTKNFAFKHFIKQFVFVIVTSADHIKSVSGINHKAMTFNNICATT